LGTETFQNPSFKRCGSPATIADRRDVSQMPTILSSVNISVRERARVAMSLERSQSSRRRVFHMTDMRDAEE
jgi:hypothetical protein